MTEPILTPFLGSQDITVYQGDCIEVMRQMPENSVDAIVTDPPYGLEFMGKEWDRLGDIGKTSHSGPSERQENGNVFGRMRVAYSGSSNAKCRSCGKWQWDHEGRKCECERPDFPNVKAHQARLMQEWHLQWCREALRILKPGGHLLAFGGTRTYHRLAAGIEDAGFEIRDCIAWMYGSGFPKSLDVSKAIDKAAGAKRKVIGVGPYANRRPRPTADTNTPGAEYGFGSGDDVTAPATPDAEKWQGWGTALKPAFEPIVVARKPLIGTVAQNVLEHGTGALNIDGCRIGTTVETWFTSRSYRSYAPGGRGSGETQSTGSAPPGRWPANVTLDEDAAAMLDERSGDLTRPPGSTRGRGGTKYANGEGLANTLTDTGQSIGYTDNGGASRFFYTAKASKKDRNTNGANNTHPTVKPTALMRWLIRLATPPGGIILDPFGGSGSTGVAARAEGVRCILIEREAEYLDIIRQRLDEGPLFANLD